MKILEICPDFPPMVRGGGAETYRLLAQEWAKEGHEVTVAFSSPRNETKYERVDGSLYKTVVFRLMKVPIGFQEATYFFPLRFKDLVRFRAFLKESGKDMNLIVIHGLQETLPLLSLFFLVKRDSRVILTQHGISSAESNWLYRILSKVLYRTIGKIAISNAKTIVAFSDRTIRDLRDYFAHYIDARIVKTDIGVDVRKLEEIAGKIRENLEVYSHWLKSDLGIQQEYLLAIGRNARTKGYDMLIRAFSEIVDDFPSLSLLIAGDPSEYTNVLKKLTVSLKIADRVFFAGRISNEEKLFLMTRTRGMIIPSRKEGYGINAVEASILGVPTVATKTGAHEDILGSCDFVRLIRPDSVQELKNAIESLLKTEFEQVRFNPRNASRFRIESLCSLYLAFLDPTE